MLQNNHARLLHDHSEIQNDLTEQLHHEAELEIKHAELHQDYGSLRRDAAVQQHSIESLDRLLENVEQVAE